MESSRSLTLSLTFEEKKPTLEDLWRILQNWQLKVGDIECVQEQYGDKMVHVKLRKSEKMEELFDYLGQNRCLKFKSEDGHIQKVFWTKNGVPINFLRIRNVPPEVEEEVIFEKLSEYGKCVHLECDRFKHGPFKGIRNGTRHVFISLRSHVPSYVTIEGYEAVVEYAGQPKTCRLCDSPHHLRANCPERYVTEAEEAADAADETADSDAAPEPRRAASEPPPTFPPLDVTPPAARAPPADVTREPCPPPADVTTAAADNSSACQSQPEQQQPVSEQKTEEEDGADENENDRERNARRWKIIEERMRERSESRKRLASKSPEEKEGVKTRSKKQNSKKNKK